MLPPVGSGPYILKEVNPGKTITYVRNPDYWAADHPCRRGMFNFDTISIKYFKDQIVSLEAFKAGDFDFMWVNIAKQWQRDLNVGADSLPTLAPRRKYDDSDHGKTDHSDSPSISNISVIGYLEDPNLNDSTQVGHSRQHKRGAAMLRGLAPSTPAPRRL